MMCAYPEEMLVQQQGNWARQKWPSFPACSLGSLTHNLLVHSRLVLQRLGVHAHNLRRAKVRGYLRTGPGSAECNPVGALVANHSHSSATNGTTGWWRWT